MLGAMQDWPLVVTHLIDHAAREYGHREHVTRWADGSETRTTWAGVRRDALKMTQALRAAGVGKGERIATLAMNHSRHLVTWYGAVGVGGVLHTINPRLFDDQLEYIVTHAEDKVLLYDALFQPIVDRMRAKWPCVQKYVCFDSGEHADAFEDWIGAHDGDCAWTEVDERDPCMLCYTSGTTGNPKGVLYQHRSTMLHAMAGVQPNIFDFDSRSVMLPVVPMFHAASWGLPWSGTIPGIKFVYSQVNDPQVLCELMDREAVTHSAGVPTVWLAMFGYLDSIGKDVRDVGKLERAVIGGSAAPKFMIERLMRNGVSVAHAWGMTETSPIGTVGSLPWNWDSMSFDEQVALVQKQGRSAFGVELRCVDLGDPQKVLPRDGVTSGALQIRGPWVIKRYFKAEADATDTDQWFDTGDVAVIYPDGTLQLTDRTKDVIKSGGEWISSVELENAAVGHPAIAEAAAIGIPHPKWDERPILVCVAKPGMDVTADEVVAHLTDKVARWWLPDAIEFVDEIPHTGTGKISKKDLRERFRDYRLERVE